MPEPSAPVNEVVYSIGFERKASLVPPRLGVALTDLIARYPNTEVQQPYDMPLELPLEKQPTAVVAPRIDFLGVDQLNIRYWLISPDEVEVVQLQPNYLATNWRRRRPDQPYPGYAALRQRFAETYDQVNRAVLAQQEEPVRPRQVELTYVNILQPDSLWQHHGEAHQVVRVQFEDVADYEQLSFAYTRGLPGPHGQGSDGFVGRMYVNVQPAVDIGRHRPAINLTLTVRSAPLDPQTLQAALEFFETAHTAITRAFRSITTEQARRVWGLL
jgi:uncharacterized protein (TIGR04255 family)